MNEKGLRRCDKNIVSSFFAGVSFTLVLIYDFFSFSSLLSSCRCDSKMVERVEQRQASPSIHRRIWFLTSCFSPLFIKLMLRCVCFSPLSGSGEAGRLSILREIYEQMFWRVDWVSLDAFNFSIDFNLFDVTWGDKDGGEWNLKQEFGRPSALRTSQLLKNQ